jgi:hypothetical protein
MLLKKYAQLLRSKSNVVREAKANGVRDCRKEGWLANDVGGIARPNHLMNAWFVRIGRST